MSAHTKFNILPSGGSHDGLLFCFSTEGPDLTALPDSASLPDSFSGPSGVDRHWLKEDRPEKKQKRKNGKNAPETSSGNKKK